MNQSEIRSRELEIQQLEEILKKRKIELQKLKHEKATINSNIGVCRSFAGVRLQCQEE